MRKIALFSLVLVFVLGVSAGAWAKEPAADASSAGAKAMLGKAVAYLKANGKEKAFAEFQNSQGQFRKGDLYVFVLDQNGVILAHGAKQRLVGKSASDLSDSDGRPILKEIVTAAQSKEAGSITYKWTKPSTKKVSPKTTYFQKVGDVIVCCGAYA